MFSAVHVLMSGLCMGVIYVFKVVIGLVYGSRVFIFHIAAVWLCSFFTALACDAAVISQVSPSGAPQGATVSVIISGSGFSPGARVRVSGTGVIVTASEVKSPDTIAATFVLSA